METRAFYSLAEEFESLAMAFDGSAIPEEREDLLTRMKAVIDELDDRVLHEAARSQAPHSGRQNCQ
jgi:hypothetical protein